MSKQKLSYKTIEILTRITDKIANEWLLTLYRFAYNYFISKWKWSWHLVFYFSILFHCCVSNCELECELKIETEDYEIVLGFRPFFHPECIKCKMCTCKIYANSNWYPIKVRLWLVAGYWLLQKWNNVGFGVSMNVWVNVVSYILNEHFLNLRNI